MSNPAVLTLDNVKKSEGSLNRFTIEDNIGESLHIHVDNMRIDLSVDEFLTFSRMIRESLEEINILCGYSINTFDEAFLRNCSAFLPQLYDIKIETVKISNLKCIYRFNVIKDLFLTKLISVKESPVYKYLKGIDNSFEHYPQYNYFNCDNVSRIKNLQESLNKNYPVDNKYIILFNDRNIIKDGQHRVAVLADTYGLDAEIEVMRFYFNGKKHIYRSLISNIRKSLLWILKRIYHKFKY